MRIGAKGSTSWNGAWESGFFPSDPKSVPVSSGEDRQAIFIGRGTIRASKIAFSNRGLKQANLKGRLPAAVDQAACFGITNGRLPDCFDPSPECLAICPGWCQIVSLG
jgi:hypothetical protein